MGQARRGLGGVIIAGISGVRGRFIGWWGKVVTGVVMLVGKMGFFMSSISFGVYGTRLLLTICHYQALVCLLNE